MGISGICVGVDRERLGRRDKDELVVFAVDRLGSVCSRVFGVGCGFSG